MASTVRASIIAPGETTCRAASTTVIAAIIMMKSAPAAAAPGRSSLWAAGGEALEEAAEVGDVEDGGCGGGVAVGVAGGRGAMEASDALAGDTIDLREDSAEPQARRGGEPVG